MSAKDSQFIERALVHPWMFWVFFWKWPRILRQVCGEYDLVAKDRDAAKAAHEQAVAANEKVRKWIHVTHQLDATADLRAIWTAGKRLSILLVFFIATNSLGQAPPYLRNQWTTNANPLALKVISTNGVHAATNVWELDFTNTATVTVSAVSNASKVMVSFTGAASGSSSLTNALLHAGPTNGSVGALILTAGTGIDLSTSGTNRVVAVTGNLTNWVNIPTNTFASGEFILRSNGFGTNTTFYSQTNFGPVIGQDALGSNIWQIATNGQIKMGKFVDTILAPGTDNGIYDIRSKEAGEGFFTEWDGGIWEKNDGSGGRSTFKLDADLNNTNINFVRFLLATRRGGITRTLSVQNSWDASTIELPGTFTWSLNSGDAGGGMFVYSNNVSAKTFSVESNGTTRVMGEIGIYPFRDGVVFLPTPTARLQISNAPNFAIPLFRAQTNASNGVLIESNGLLVAMSGFQLTSGTPGAGKVLTDVAGDGVATWETASGGSGIGSIYTNNALAGGPGLTELGFTNTATVTWAATTNAGRVTMSATSSGGSQTPWLSDIDAAAFSLTNFGTQLAFTNGTILLQTKANEIGLTNGNLKLPTNAFGRILFGNSITNAAISYQTVAGGTDGEGLGFYIGANPRLWIDPSGHTHMAAGRFLFYGGSGSLPSHTISGSNLILAGNHVPSAATTYTLGTSTTPWKGVYESSSFRGRFATNASWTISTNFYVHAWTEVAVLGTVTLPSASTCSNLHIVIKDEGGNASATNLTIAVQSDDRIDGATTSAINVNYGAKNIYSAGSTNWFIY